MISEPQSLGASWVALLAGVDEAGRGPLAGPVVAAAVILPAEFQLPGLADSKQLTRARRDALAPQIRAVALAYGLGIAEAAEIDELNILQATLLAMRRALLALGVAPARVVIDGNRLPDTQGLGFSAAFLALPKADATVPVVSAASILAKTWRDDWMEAAEADYPGYGFAVHKGYPVPQHLAALRALGPCALHRRSFAPVRRTIEQRALVAAGASGAVPRTAAGNWP